MRKPKCQFWKFFIIIFDQAKNYDALDCQENIFSISRKRILVMQIVSNAESIGHQLKNSLILKIFSANLDKKSSVWKTFRASTFHDFCYLGDFQQDCEIHQGKANYFAHCLEKIGGNVIFFFKKRYFGGIFTNLRHGISRLCYSVSCLKHLSEKTKKLNFSWFDSSFWNSL